ncbi:MAG: hypothetical protein JXB49_02795 [Bacteroidales bacterium]|nr:hypothetical protein [Bacteroidales bacterium]
MEKEITRQEKIDAYLLNQMSSSERAEFELQFDSDRELQEEIRIQKMIIEEINDRESFLSLIDQKKKKKVLTRKIWRVISIAAVFTGLLGFFIIQPTTISNKNIYSAFSDIQPGIIEREKVSDPLRGEEYIIPGLSMTDSEFGIKGLDYFVREDYINASSSFQQIQNIKTYPELMLYMAISQLKSQQSSSALINLEYLSSLKDFKSAELAKYYLSLGYINTGKILKARPVLKEIAKAKGTYSTKASEMLSKMRWF